MSENGRRYYSVLLLLPSVLLADTRARRDGEGSRREWRLVGFGSQLGVLRLEQ